MLVLLPPSEGKTAPARRGKPVDIPGLGFPALTDVRERLLDGLIATSARDDGSRWLGAPPGAAVEVAANVRLRSAPTRPVSEVYTGVLYQALDPATLDAAAKRRAARWLVVTSALWGALRWTDRIPAYRMQICAMLPGTADHLEPMWRSVLDPVLTEAAGNDLILDLRSSSYLAMWRPKGATAERWVRIGARNRAGVAISHQAKHSRGLVARALLTAGRVPRRITDLPAVLDGFDVRLTAPPRPGAGWTLDVIVD